MERTRLRRLVNSQRRLYCVLTPFPATQWNTENGSVSSGKFMAVQNLARLREKGRNETAGGAYYGFRLHHVASNTPGIISFQFH